MSHQPAFRMRTGLIIGFIASLLINAGAFAAFAIAFRPAPPAPKEDLKVSEIIFEQEQIQPPPPEEVPEDLEPASEAAVEEAVASLPEPPPAVMVDGGITEVFRPTPPVPPRPDGLTQAFAPTRKGGGGTGGTGTGLGASIFSIFDLDRQPQTRVRPQPTYPFELRRQGIGGNAVIRIQVDEQGNVFDAQVLRATHPDFGRAAREAALRIKMTPGTKNGKAVRFTFDAPYSFNLDSGR